MSKKKVKVKKAKKEVAKGYKGLRAGSNIEKLAKYHDDKKPEREDFIAYAEKQGINRGYAASAWQFIKNGYSKTKK